jgi:hypothetical protein
MHGDVQAGADGYGTNHGKGGINPAAQGNVLFSEPLLYIRANEQSMIHPKRNVRHP